MKKWTMKLVLAIVLAMIITGTIALGRFPDYFLHEAASGNGLRLIVFSKLFIISFLTMYWTVHMSYTTVVRRTTLKRFFSLVFQYFLVGMGFVLVAMLVGTQYPGAGSKVLLEQAVYVEKIACTIPFLLLIITDFRKLPSVIEMHKSALTRIGAKAKKIIVKVAKPLYKAWLHVMRWMRKLESACLGGLVIVVTFIMMEIYCKNAFWLMELTHICENLLLYTVVYVVLWVFIHRTRVTSIVMLSFFMVAGIVNYFTICFRGNPVTFGDLTVINTALSVAGGFKYTIDLLFVIAFVIGALMIVLFAMMKEEKKKISVPAYVIPLVLTCMIVFFTGSAMIKKDFLYRRMDPIGWNPKLQAETNGYLLTFAADTSKTLVTEPEKHVPADLNESLCEVDEQILIYEGEEGVYPNLIVVMNESLADLSVLGELETDEEYLPYLQSLTEDTIYGNLYVSAYGGNTVFSEFEFLTGNSMAFLPGGTIPYIQYIDQEQTPSLAWTLKQQEVPYEAIAIHPFGKAGYNRSVVYKSFGFDDFITEEDFEDCTIYRKYITDEDDYKKVFEIFEAKEEGQPLFVFNITMQNHGGYGERTDYTLREPVHVTSFEVGCNVDEYLSSIKESDTALEMLIEYFEKEEEPTIILMFGDHHPALDEGFYENIYGKDTDTLNHEEQMRKHCVPFVMWSNYQDLGGEYVDKISPNYLSTMLLEVAGLERTQYQQYLSTIYDEYPVITGAGVFDAKGNLRDANEIKGQSSILQEYEAIQYNYLFEREERLDTYFYPEE